MRLYASPYHFIGIWNLLNYPHTVVIHDTLDDYLLKLRKRQTGMNKTFCEAISFAADTMIRWIEQMNDKNGGAVK